MAWLIALRVGNLCVWRSRSTQTSRRLTEAALAGGLFGFLQGLLFAVIAPSMGPIQADELTRTIILILIMIFVGTLSGAGLSFFTAYLNEQRRYYSVEYRNLGRAGVKVSAIGIGCNQFGGKVDATGTQAASLR